MRHVVNAVVAIAAALPLYAAGPDARAMVAERVMRLTRDSQWKPVSTTAMRFNTYHPQGMVKIGDTFYITSVEVKVSTKRLPQTVDGYDRDPGAGVGHLFKVDLSGNLLADLVLGEGTIYHPGGIDYDGDRIWVPVAEYRPNSRSIIYRVDPATMKATEVGRFADHIGAIVHDSDAHALHGVSWGSRRFYRWTVASSGRITNAAARPETIPALNSSHYVDYQDCKYAGRHRMLCTGVAEIRQSPGAVPFRLGGIDLVDLADGRPLHQVPLLLWTASGLDMTHNPAWIEASPAGIRAYFMPEDNESTLYIYEVQTE